eukprot:PhM_4_TR2876/c1_g1_i1/m.54993
MASIHAASGARAVAMESHQHSVDLALQRRRRRNSSKINAAPSPSATNINNNNNNSFALNNVTATTSSSSYENDSDDAATLQTVPSMVGLHHHSHHRLLHANRNNGNNNNNNYTPQPLARRNFRNSFDLSRRDDDDDDNSGSAEDRVVPFAPPVPMRRHTSGGHHLPDDDDEVELIQLPPPPPPPPQSNNGVDDNGDFHHPPMIMIPDSDTAVSVVTATTTTNVNNNNNSTSPPNQERSTSIGIENDTAGNSLEIHSDADGDDDEREHVQLDWWLRHRQRIEIYNFMEGMSTDVRLVRYQVAYVLFNILMIAISTTSFIIDSLPEYYEDDRSSRIGTPLFIVDTICIVYFTLELLARWVIFPYGRDRRFWTAFNVIDAISVSGFFIEVIFLLLSNTNVQLQIVVILRIARLARVVRVMKLSRYNSSFILVVRVMKSSTESLFLLLFLLSIAVVVFSTTAFFAENWTMAHFDQHEKKWLYDDDDSPSAFQSIPDTFWWTMVTVSTVGYGDKVPRSVAAKLVATGVMLFGLLCLSLPTILIAANFAAVHRNHHRNRARSALGRLFRKALCTTIMCRLVMKDRFDADKMLNQAVIQMLAQQQQQQEAAAGGGAGEKGEARETNSSDGGEAAQPHGDAADPNRVMAVSGHSDSGVQALLESSTKRANNNNNNSNNNMLKNKDGKDEGKDESPDSPASMSPRGSRSSLCSEISAFSVARARRRLQNFFFTHADFAEVNWRQFPKPTPATAATWEVNGISLVTALQHIMCTFSGVCSVDELRAALANSQFIFTTLTNPEVFEACLHMANHGHLTMFIINRNHHTALMALTVKALDVLEAYDETATTGCGVCVRCASEAADIWTSSTGKKFYLDAAAKLKKGYTTWNLTSQRVHKRIPGVDLLYDFRTNPIGIAADHMLTFGLDETEGFSVIIDMSLRRHADVRELRWRYVRLQKRLLEQGTTLRMLAMEVQEMSFMSTRQQPQRKSSSKQDTD